MDSTRVGDHRGSPDADHFTTFLTSYSWLTKIIQTPLQLPCDRSFISIFATIQKHLDLHCNGNYITFHTRNDQKEHFIALNTCVYHSNKFPAYIPLMLFDYKSGQDICTYKWCNPIHFVRTKWIGFASQSKWIIWKTFNLFDMTSKFHYYDYRQIQVFSLLDPWKLKHLKNLRKWLSNLLKTLLNFGLNCITRISKWSFRPFLRMVMNRLLYIVNQSNHRYYRRS